MVAENCFVLNCIVYVEKLDRNEQEKICNVPVFAFNISQRTSEHEARHIEV